MIDRIADLLRMLRDLIDQILANMDDPPPPPPAPDTENPDLWAALCQKVAATDAIPHQLKPVMLAQAALESGRGTSRVARECLNFHGMKWRPEMGSVAQPREVEVTSEPSGRATFCAFRTIDDAIRGWWLFLARNPYQGHETRLTNPTAWIQFIGPIWCPLGYVDSWKRAHEGRDYDDEVMRLAVETEQKLIDLGWEPPRPGAEETGRMRAWIPHALDWRPRFLTRGKYPQGYPEGAVVHFTAGWRKGTDACDTANKSGWNFVCITGDGKLLQGAPLSHWGAHSGTSHHRRLVGIEVACAGKVTPKGQKFVSWFGEEYDGLEVRQIHRRTENQYPGHYLRFTDAQERALVDLLMWLKAEAPTIFDFDKVIGHDEACDAEGRAGDKVDPGGSLSMTMPAFRKFLHEDWARRARA